MAIKASERNRYLHVPAIGCSCVIQHDYYCERMFLDGTVVE